MTYSEEHASGEILSYLEKFIYKEKFEQLQDEGV